jgi:hypothetical protein
MDLVCDHRRQIVRLAELKIIMKKIIVTLICIYSLLLLGCPKASIAGAKSASQKVATYANAGVNLTRELYRSNFLTLAQKDKIADGFIVLANAGIAFDAAVANTERIYGSDAPKPEIDRLIAIFDGQIVEQFLAVLQSLKLVPAAGNYKATIELLKTAIITLAKAFGIGKQTRVKIALAT